MNYVGESEDIAMMNTNGKAIPRRRSLVDDSEIPRIRESLLIMPVVCLTLSMIGSIFLLILFHVITEIENIQPMVQIGHALISILLHVFGLFVVYRSSRLGLRVFAWLYAMMIVLTSVGVLLVLLFTFTNPTFSHFIRVQTNDSTATIFVVFFIIFCICFSMVFILSVMIVKLTLKLARLIDASQSLINQQI